MFDSFYIAWKYVSYNKIKTATLVGVYHADHFPPLFPCNCFSARASGN